MIREWLRKGQRTPDEEEAQLEREIQRLRDFFAAVPRLREESLRMAPPTREVPLPLAPTRRELRLLRWESYAHGLKLLVLLGFLVGAALWAFERISPLAEFAVR